jgi:AAA ATPase domain
VDIVLVGRHRELAEIERLLAAALAGRGATVLVTGEAGIGKSTVLAEALSEPGNVASRRRSDVPPRTTRRRPCGRGRTLWPGCARPTSPRT